MTKYKPREIYKTLADTLQSMPVVVLSGMRQTGKSTILLNEPLLKKRRYFNFDDFNILETARRNPESITTGDGPVTIDEAQKYPEIMTHIKREVDKNLYPGKFLLSGSANLLLLKSVSESLAGRAIYLTLNPFTRREIAGNTGQTPYIVKFIEKRSLPISKSKLNPIGINEIMQGGMPSVCLRKVKDKDVWFRGYEQTYLERDLRSLSQVADLISFRNLLQLTALRSAQILNQSELARDAKLNAITTSRYLSLMETSFVVHRLPPHLRNRSSRLIKSPKIYFTDSGIVSYLMGVKNLNLTETIRGTLMEGYVLQNLQGILSAHLPDAKITYWNIQGRLEVDFIIELGSTTFAIEVKNSSRFNERDLKGIKAFLTSSKDCQGAILAYNGKEVLKLENRIWAVPIHQLLS